MEEVSTEKTRPLARGTLRLQSDERLVKLFRRGVEPAFDELVRRYRGALVGYAGSIAGRDRAEDVVQDSLVKAHRSLAADRDIEPKPWLYTLVRNTALNDIRDNRKHSHDGLGESAGGGSGPDELIEQRERFAAVLAAVADLPPAQRRALVDHEMSGLSHEEIAAELELSTGATKQLIYRARLSLRNAFGAMIPIPLIAWLAEGSGMVATGAAGSGAAATGVLGSIGGGGAAKLAVVAVVAGGSLAGGIAVEKNRAETQRGPDSARASEASPAAASEAEGTGVTAIKTSADPEPVDARPQGSSGTRHDKVDRNSRERESGDTGTGNTNRSDRGSGSGSEESRHTGSDDGTDRRPSGERPDRSGPDDGHGDRGGDTSGGGRGGGDRDGQGPAPQRPPDSSGHGSGGSGSPGGSGTYRPPERPTSGGSGGGGDSGSSGSGSSGSGSSGGSGSGPSGSPGSGDGGSSGKSGDSPRDFSAPPGSSGQ